MAKEKSERKEKKEKTPKKEKTTEENGVKKSKKDKKSKTVVEASEDVTTVLLNSLEEDKPGSVAVNAEGAVVVHVPAESEQDTMVVKVPIGALVPFAHPLADEKSHKKCLKGVKKAAKVKHLKRGVKEVVKGLRKSPTAVPASKAIPHGIVIIAADISPMDVISHLPVLCEDHGIPYMFVTSRAELGAAGNTKRPTSVVMITRDRNNKSKEEVTEEEKEFDDAYKDLVKLVEKASRSVKI